MQAQAPVAPEADTLRAAAERGEQLHIFEFGGGYEPGPGPNVALEYFYTGFPHGYLSVTAGWAGQLLGSLGYTHHIDLAGEGRPRVTISPALFSDFVANRFLDQLDASERRTGARLNVAYRRAISFRWTYNQFVETSHARIHLSPDEAANSLTDLTTLETGPRFRRAAFEGLLPFDWLLEGNARAGWDHSQDVAFARVRLGTRYHHAFSEGFASSTEVRGEWASANAPVFERLSFGGSVTVRGYRRDEFIGRSLWNLQQELWMPVPGTMGASRGFRRTLRDHLRIATFFDVGGVGETLTEGDEGVRAGTGIGIRFNLGGITFRADWGHRLTDLQDGNLRGGFFIGIQPDISVFMFG